MRRIYTGIDIGSDSIKIVVSEVFNKKFHVLASTSVKSKGVRRGLIIDKEKVSNSIKTAVKEIEATIGIKIEEAVVTIPSNDRKLSVESGTTKIVLDTVSGEDIVNALSDAVIDRVPEGYELITTVPITFKIDDMDNIIDPKGRAGEYLSVKAVMITAPKKNLFDVLEVCNMCGIEAKDVIFKTIGDYYEARGKDTEVEVGAIVDVGSDTTSVSIFNKDISYIYGVDLATARDLKENFSVCSRKYADSNDSVEIKINDNDVIKINQYELSEAVEARVNELLKLAKKSINNLTNRKISYIIVTGGITELTGFGYIVENVLGINATTLNITTLGIRNNKYSAAMGIIKYFHEKLKLRDIDYTMFDDEKINALMDSKKSLLNVNNDTLVSKIFDYFTGN